ncbi:glutathione S-transferase family protein [Hoeflea poritis]|uniref:Glutathione S-transferase family protein n=1 Tax=Hoeflea poritis TaxID=2993659 RepID=A0ABT4VQI7_9HYPH|nr:glutathione S-transferase family protein [Hoeflea poritis]MDA4846980.1 glutathione S-transferase family protein [Hoeflea poritis]
MTIMLYELAGRDAARPFSPHCWKTVMSLAHKGLEFERSAVPFTGVPEVENRFGKTVPVLRDGDKVISDSFDIALYLEETYPDRPTLFGGEGGVALSRFMEAWSASQIHTTIGGRLLLDIHAMLEPQDQAYFRESREARFGRPLEDVVEAGAERIREFGAKLEPLRLMLKRQPFIGGEGPLFADYIVFGAFQWARVCSAEELLEPDDPVSLWFDRCLDLHAGIGRSVAAAA